MGVSIGIKRPRNALDLPQIARAAITDKGTIPMVLICISSICACSRVRIVNELITIDGSTIQITGASIKYDSLEVYISIINGEQARYWNGRMLE